MHEKSGVEELMHKASVVLDGEYSRWFGVGNG